MTATARSPTSGALRMASASAEQLPGEQDERPRYIPCPRGGNAIDGISSSNRSLVASSMCR